MTKIKIISFDVDWSVGAPARLSFIAKLSNGYIMEGCDLRGDITIKKDKPRPKYKTNEEIPEDFTTTMGVNKPEKTVERYYDGIFGGG